ncbi:unnamed protein product [Adineta steineri]|uniref:Uncharacterized protein n=1 Tax=Adineta steineri TaxID=433720 RepID=A0A813QJS0_9BILA|nr:unnamed protein product [Adineta steineri]CAF0768711.1 unnamed protein product [Adineta steineri]CAF3661969.1 unnamed protein product [Adineta steineri]CAF4151196.1 unnamed protein product [Adineta steineri]
MMQHSSKKSSGDKKHVKKTKDSLPSNKITVGSEYNESIIYSFKNDYGKQLEELEREADMQSKEIELNNLVEYVSQLVDLLKHTVLIPELQIKYDWHEDHEHQLKRNKGSTGNSLLDDRVQQIAIEKGLTREQWKHLLYLNFTAGDSLDMINVSKSHLKKVHDMASRLLEPEEKAAAFALVDAIERYMPEDHYIDR